MKARRLLLACLALSGAGSLVCGLLGIWTDDSRWTETSIVCLIAGSLVALAVAFHAIWTES